MNYQFLEARVFKFHFFFKSLVTAAWKEPIPGWIENLNGPTGLIVGAGKGVIRTMHCNENYVADIMPVDLAINAVVVAAWHVGSTK